MACACLSTAIHSRQLSATVDLLLLLGTVRFVSDCELCNCSSLQHAGVAAYLTCNRTGCLGLGGSGSAWQNSPALPLLSHVSSSVSFACRKQEQQLTS